jgi:hypothetical protein
VTAVRTIEHRIGGEPATGSPTGTAPVGDPATGARQAVVTERRPSDVGPSAASSHLPTST